MTGDTFKITIHGEGLNVEREISVHVVTRILPFILGGQASDFSQARGGDLPLSPLDELGSVGTVSVREFLDTCEPKRNPDKIAAFGLFLKQHRSQSSFTRADLEALFQEAAEPVPGNLARDIRWAVRNGWIAERADDKGAYYLTNKGMEAVKMKFPPDILKKTTLPPARSRRNTAAKASTE